MARRSPADGAALDPAVTQKKRARRRLVGALVLGIAAAIVLPLVLDSEPRQTITDVEIEIPPREAALPSLDPPSQADATASAAAAPADDAVVPPTPIEAQASTTQPKAEAPAGADKRSSAKTEAPKVATAKPHSEASTPVRSEPGTAKAPAKPSPTPTGTSAVPAGAGRFALQVGAFASAGSARAQLDKARRTGLRAYTETVSTTQGERTRVRVGPFATRDEAEKARATLKLSGIDSSVVDAR